jgi:predicted transposase/invertase (TIGR01784 family)
MFSVWMFFLKNPELIPEEFITKVPEVHEALEELKVMSMDDEFRAAYRAHIKAKNDQTSREANAEARGKAEGIAEGISVGKAEGKAEGMAEGMAVGKAEGIAEGKRETALTLLSMGLSVEQIATATNLSIREIESLKNT